MISFLTLCACFVGGIIYILIAGMGIIRDDEIEQNEIVMKYKHLR